MASCIERFHCVHVWKEITEVKLNYFFICENCRVHKPNNPEIILIIENFCDQSLKIQLNVELKIQLALVFINDSISKNLVIN